MEDKGPTGVLREVKETRGNCKELHFGLLTAVVICLSPYVLRAFFQVMSSPDVKEELYGALDTWVAWELEFPLVAVKKAVKILQEMEEHKKVIQVCADRFLLEYALLGHHLHAYLKQNSF